MSKFQPKDKVYFNGLDVEVVSHDGQKYTIQYANGATGEVFESDLVRIGEENGDVARWEDEGGAFPQWRDDEADVHVDKPQLPPKDKLSTNATVVEAQARRITELESFVQSLAQWTDDELRGLSWNMLRKMARALLSK